MHLSASAARRRPSCETWCKEAARWIAAASVSIAIVLGVAAADAQLAAASIDAGVHAQPAHDAAGAHPAAEGQAAEGEHGESIWGTVGKVFNFAVLAAVLVYFLRQPL